MTTIADTRPVRRGSSPAFRKALPYILSLPALLVCVLILIPFVTAVYYSLLRYRLNLPVHERLHLVRQLHVVPHATPNSGTRSGSRCSTLC